MYTCLVDDVEYRFTCPITSGAELRAVVVGLHPQCSLHWERLKTVNTNKHVGPGPDLVVSDSQRIDRVTTSLHFYTLPPHGF